MFLGIVCTYDKIGCHGNHPGSPSGKFYGLAPAMCGPRHVVLYFLILVRTITAEFLWIRTTRTGKKYIFFICWSRGWFRCHGNQIQTRRWHTGVCGLPFPNIYIYTLPNLLGWFVIYGKILLFCLGLSFLKCKKWQKSQSWNEFMKCANMYCIFE